MDRQTGRATDSHTEMDRESRDRKMETNRQMERKNRQPYRVKDAVRQIGGQAEG